MISMARAFKLRGYGEFFGINGFFLVAADFHQFGPGAGGKHAELDTIHCQTESDAPRHRQRAVTGDGGPGLEPIGPDFVSLVGLRRAVFIHEVRVFRKNLA